MSGTYECAVCHRILDKGWTDQEAVAELREKWPDFAECNCDLVCDTCYRAMGSPTQADF